MFWFFGLQLCVASPPNTLLFVEPNGEFFLTIEPLPKDRPIELFIDGLGDIQIDSNHPSIFLEGKVKSLLQPVISGVLTVHGSDPVSHELEIIPIWLPSYAGSLLGEEHLPLPKSSQRRWPWWRRLFRFK